MNRSIFKTFLFICVIAVTAFAPSTKKKKKNTTVRSKVTNPTAVGKHRTTDDNPYYIIVY